MVYGALYVYIDRQGARSSCRDWVASIIFIGSGKQSTPNNVLDV